jgi:phage protein D
MVDWLAPELKVEVNGSKLSADVSKNITSAGVTLRADLLDECQLTLANPYPEMRWTHGSDATLFEEGAGLKVSMGYVDQVAPLFDGEVVGISPSFPEGGTPTLTVTGRSRMHRLKTASRSHTYTQQKDSDIVSTLVSAAGLTASVDDTGTQHEYVLQWNQTDLDFILARARRIGYEVWSTGKTLNFKKPRSASAKVYTLVWGRTSKAFNPSMKTMPLRSFTPRMDAQGQVGEVTVRSLDPVTREKIEGKATSSDLTKKMGATSGPEAAAKAFGAKAALLVTDEPVTTQAEAEQRAKAILNERAMKFVSGTGATIGIPDLLPGTTMEIDGVGPKFTGLYYVVRTVHSLGTGGYTTTFDVQRNAIG